MKIDIVDNGSFSVVKPAGRLDVMTSGEFQEAGAKIAEANANILLDLSGIDYMSSAGIRAILYISKKSAASGGNFALCAMQQPVFDVFRLAGFETMIKCFDTLSEAEESFK